MNVVELPVQLQNLLLLVIGMAVTFGLTQLAKWGFDFSGYQAKLVAAFFSAAMVVINYALGMIPAGYEGIAVALLNLLVVLLGAFGVYKTWKDYKAKKAQG